MGWDRDGFGRDGFNRDHFDRDGYDIYGHNRYGFNRANMAAFGMKGDGTMISSMTKELVNQLFPDGFNRYGFSPYGLDRAGLDAFGFRVDGYDKDQCNFFLHGPHYLRFYFYAQLQMSVAEVQSLSTIKRICPPVSLLPPLWANRQWLGLGSEEGRYVIGLLEQQWEEQRPFDKDYNPHDSSVRATGLWLPITPDLRFCFELPWFSGCPVGVAPVECPDLCQDSLCPGQPDAQCHVHTCGSCFTEWIHKDTGEAVMCQEW
ncbi:uncharacterized protein LOC118818235 [Colossoma macropomum]|uniref:uncharacterized protein LOC118818235 n=1 Tax=Colossoma macropomum TaxID=42526 RepID=UPI001864612F|nr:uncharacterized protein LOC118818235 [Colossoma macropomum]